jgi:hypothetical protein
MVQEHRGKYPALCAAVESIVIKIGYVSQTLLEQTKREVTDTGLRDGLTTSERERLKALEFLKIHLDKYRDMYGVEPICKVLQIGPAEYCRHAARSRNPV